VKHDPREGGFVAGLGALLTGGYDARLADRDRNLAELDEENRDLRARRANVHIEASDVHAAAATATQQLAMVRADQLAVHSKLAAVERARTIDQNTLARLRTEVSGLDAKVRDTTSSEAAIATMRRRQADLLAELDALLRVSDMTR
jgi:chromosome segregation ATPase